MAEQEKPRAIVRPAMMDISRLRDPDEKRQGEVNLKTKIGVSACLLGSQCNFEGKDLLNQFVTALGQNPEIEFVQFCPEHAVFGTPRLNLRIVGGDGFDVLDGKASVIDESNRDVTVQQVIGASQFLKRLVAEEVKCAILMDGSPSCGSNVLLREENWPAGGFKRGVGVAAALLRRNGIQVFSSFDLKALSQFLQTTIKGFEAKSDLTDLRENPKFKTLFQ
jgi:uncharacterized protein YbbK (DUF523 family)